MSLKTLISKIKSERVKFFIFFEKDAFQFGKRISLEDLNSKKELRIPKDIELFLLELAQGYINDLHIHGTDNIYPFDKETGLFAGLVTFASDSLGNYFAYSPNSENPSEIYYCIHDEKEPWVISKNIEEFLREFVNNDLSVKAIINQVGANDC